MNWQITAGQVRAVLAFAGGMLVASDGISMEELTSLATSLLADVNTIAGALLALSPDGLAAAKAIAAKLAAGKQKP